MKISLYVLVHVKIIPWKFRILNHKNSRVICRWILHFSEKVGYFLTYFIASVCLQTNTSYISGTHYSKNKCCCNAKPWAYCFYEKTKISVDFQIYISVSSKKLMFVQSWWYALICHWLSTLRSFCHSCQW